MFFLPRALELFVESLLTKAVQITSARNAKTLSPAHLYAILLICTDILLISSLCFKSLESNAY